jgi:hypothetical protein
MKRACWYCPYNSCALPIPAYNCACALLHFQANKTSVHYPPCSRPDVLLHKYTTLTLWDRPLTGAVSISHRASWEAGATGDRRMFRARFFGQRSRSSLQRLRDRTCSLKVGSLGRPVFQSRSRTLERGHSIYFYFFNYIFFLTQWDSLINNRYAVCVARWRWELDGRNSVGNGSANGRQ